MYWLLGGCGTTALPVEIEYFKLPLSWKFSKVTNVFSLELQYSTEAWDWQTLEKYYTIEENIEYSSKLENVGFYRLKITDYGGAHSFSKVLRIQGKTKNFKKCFDIYGRVTQEEGMYIQENKLYLKY